MKHIEFSEKEAADLREILESYLSGLQTERAHTDNRDMRQEIKAQEAFLNNLIKRLNP